MSAARNTFRRLLTGLTFLAPSIAGFLAFTVIPLVLSFILAFTNWDVRRHNMFRAEPIEFIGLANFERMFSHPAFWQYLGNTLFFMLGIPVAIMGSLIAALLLTKELNGPAALRRIHFVAMGVLMIALAVLLLTGYDFGNMMILVGLLFGAILLTGLIGRATVYRTIFYAPHFTAGVATFLLWKKMYNPHTGPVNAALRPVVSAVQETFQGLPLWTGPLLGVFMAVLGLVLITLLYRRIGQAWIDGELGRGAWLGLMVLSLLPVGLGWRWLQGSWLAVLLVVAHLGMLVWWVLRPGLNTPFRQVSAGQGFAGLVLPVAGAVVGQLMFIGLALVMLRLPGMAAAGDMAPPDWLADFYWAKPAIMIMAFWAAVGSNNMILYIAGITNIPQELYEAAEIDGANSWQRFWNVTWPQLAPVTFFIVVMSVIHGLQGGFEMARAMTQGGPAGATTTLSYFVFIEGFESGRLGYASAVVWALFAMVMFVTLLNFKFGNRNVND
ncbi:MAG: ABC transporter permease subunit [Cephaloticoccus sp.]|nr:ABC transporter permease subunit [Cephaloticoccus sp.]